MRWAVRRKKWFKISTIIERERAWDNVEEGREFKSEKDKHDE